MQKKKHYRKVIIIFYACVLLLLICFAALQYKTTGVEPIELIQSKSLTEDYEAPLVLTLTASKEWSEGGSRRGMQYDATIYNKTRYAMKDWEVNITLPEDSYLSDSWSMSADVIDNHMTVRCVDYNETMLVSQPTTFGFILIGHDLGNIGNITIEATPIYKITDYPAFWVLCAFACGLIVFAIVFIAIEQHTKAYEKQLAEDRELISQCLKTFVNFIDAKDNYTKGHSSRVAYYSRALAIKLGLSDKEIDKIYYTALLHDVGKVGIPDSILGKKGPLTPDEKAVIETHTTNGKEFLKDFTAIPGVLDGILYHHERYDGKGYPTGLSGESIPLVARIICVADAYDAMSSERCYRSRLSMEKIRSELVDNSGTQFDPKIAAIMLELLNSESFYTTMLEYTK
jgi:hypothetical protein